MTRAIVALTLLTAACGGPESEIQVSSSDVRGCATPVQHHTIVGRTTARIVVPPGPCGPSPIAITVAPGTRVQIAVDGWVVTDVEARGDERSLVFEREAEALARGTGYTRKYDSAPMPHSVFYHAGFATHGPQVAEAEVELDEVVITVDAVR